MKYNIEFDTFVVGKVFEVSTTINNIVVFTEGCDLYYEEAFEKEEAIEMLKKLIEFIKESKK